MKHGKEDEKLVDLRILPFESLVNLILVGMLAASASKAEKRSAPFAVEAGLNGRGGLVMRDEQPDVLNRTLAAITALFLGGVVVHFAMMAIAGP